MAAFFPFSLAHPVHPASVATFDADADAEADANADVDAKRRSWCTGGGGSWNDMR